MDSGGRDTSSHLKVCRLPELWGVHGAQLFRWIYHYSFNSWELSKSEKTGKCFNLFFLLQLHLKLKGRFRKTRWVSREQRVTDIVCFFQQLLFENIRYIQWIEYIQYWNRIVVLRVKKLLQRPLKYNCCSNAIKQIEYQWPSNRCRLPG